MDDRQSSRQMVGTLTFILAGPILWAVDLTAIYGAQSSLCAFDALSQPIVGWLVIAISALLALAAGIAAVRPRPLFGLLAGAPPPAEQWQFLQGAMRLLVGLSVLAIAYFTLAATLLPACAQLR